MQMAPQSSEYSYASMAKIAALAAGGDLDIIIADAKTLEHYESQGAFLDLKDFLPEDLLDRAETEGLFFYTDNEKGQSIAAIFLDSTDFSELTGASIHSPYLAVIASSQHTEDTLRAIQWLFDQKSIYCFHSKAFCQCRSLVFFSIQAQSLAERTSWE